MYRAPCSILDGPATLRKISSVSKFKIVEFSQLVITSTDSDILSIGSVFGRFYLSILSGPSLAKFKKWKCFEFF